jgi:hypothetical protein
MSDRNILQDWKPFIMSGKAIFTLENQKTGNRMTFKVTNSHNKKVWYVTVLTGPDNSSNYTYIGMINPEGKFVMTKKSQVGPDACRMVS